MATESSTSTGISTSSSTTETSLPSTGLVPVTTGPTTGSSINGSDSSTTENNSGNIISGNVIENSSENSSNKTVIAIAVAVPLAFLLIFAILIFFLIRRRRNNKKVDNESPKDVPKSASIELSNRTVKSMGLIKEVKILEKLGGGKFGEVFLGEWNTVSVALKKLRSQESLSEFEKEADVLRQLRHPHVLQFFGIYKQDFDYYMVTEVSSKCYVIYKYEN